VSCLMTPKGRNMGDYTPIGGSSYGAYKKQWQPGGETGSPLYNGNISNSTVAIRGIGTGNNPAGYTYAYDQLNRLVKMRQQELDNTSATWNSSGINNKYKENYSYDANGNILRLARYGGGGQIMDSLTYGYTNDLTTGKLKNNMLSALTDISGSSSVGELTGTSIYEYDKIGNLRTDINQKVRNIQWSVYGKIKQMTTGAGVDTTVVKYTYDPSGNRVSKTVGTALTTWYVRDAQGNALAVYDNAGGAVNWREQQLYGSSRLGMWKPGTNIATTDGTAAWNSANKKNYELTNHLGNVLAVITDKDSVGADGMRTPSVLSAQDYYPFGMIQPGRSYSSSAYRYGFNGKENDNEVKGLGNEQDYGMRIYDPRVGRFLSVDPITKKYPGLTPYQFASNSPVGGIDQDGLEFVNPVVKMQETWQGKTVFNVVNFIDALQTVVVGTIAVALELPAQAHYGDKIAQQDQDAAFPLTSGQNFGSLALGVAEAPIRAVGDVIYNPSDPRSWGQLAGTALLYKTVIKEKISIFKYDAKTRGFAYETMKGGNLPTNFPVIDRLYNREVTSIKSIDLTAKSYKSNSVLYNTLRKYVDALDKFKEATMGEKSIEIGDYSSKKLDIGYQRNKATKAQLKVLNEIKKYAKDKDIKIEFNEVK